MAKLCLWWSFCVSFYPFLHLRSVHLCEVHDPTPCFPAARVQILLHPLTYWTRINLGEDGYGVLDCRSLQEMVSS